MTDEKTASPVPAVVTQKQLADWLGLSVQSICRLTAEGYLPPMVELSPHRKVFLRSQVDEWLKKRLQVAHE
jgi:predicted DNA-binding transcriptional regulator AlpA